VPTIGVPTAIAPTWTPSPAPVPTLTQTPSASDPPGGGTLTLSADSVLLSPLIGGSLTLTANGGPVSWSIAEPDSVLGSLTVSQSSGTLSDGQSVTVALTAPQLGSLHTQLTVEPGEQPVTVLLARG
jgi:hypothetical protein